MRRGIVFIVTGVELVALRSDAFEIGLLFQATATEVIDGLADEFGKLLEEDNSNVG